VSPSCSSVTALHWQRYIGTLDPAKVCVWHCDTGTQVFASLQCTHLPKRMSIGTRIPPHNRVSRQYRDGPDTVRGVATPWPRISAVSCTYRLRVCVVSHTVSCVSAQVSASERGRIHIRIGTRIPSHNRVSRQYRDGPDTRLGPASALSLARIDCVSASSHTPYGAYQRRYQHQSGDITFSKYRDFVS